MDLARSIQVITEEVMLKMARFVHRETGMKQLCLAGGVALNCVANGRLIREIPFDDVWIQPAAGDAGGALGVALAVWHRYLEKPRQSAEKSGLWQSSTGVHGNGLPEFNDAMHGSFLGPRDSLEEIEEFLCGRNLPYKKYSPEELAEVVANLLAEGNVIGLHQGRMEFGPRALGGRSIIGDARSPRMQSVMNLKIKYRESFRPFAPSVLREYAGEWFDLQTDSPYMLVVANVASDKLCEVSREQQALWGIDKLNVQRSQIPAVTHVDNTARIQTVRRETNPLYWDIIEAFRKLTGCPVVVNTSFNVRGEPIVCRPSDSYRCFMRTEMDYLVLETCILDKKDQPPFADTTDWRSQFTLD
jgi:carbamoyltransferase